MKTILVVDDNKEVRELVKTTLGMESYQVLECSSGEEALGVAQQALPDLIILDISMPGGMNGIEVVRRLKSGPQPLDCPIIILSGMGRRKHKKEALEAGALDFFAKPFSPLELIEKVEQILN